MTYMTETNQGSRQAIDHVLRWMKVNGCRHLIAADEPIIVKGGWIEYVAMCRNDKKSMDRMRVHNDSLVFLGKRRIRNRITLSKVA